MPITEFIYPSTGGFEPPEPTVTFQVGQQVVVTPYGWFGVIVKDNADRTFDVRMAEEVIWHCKAEQLLSVSLLELMAHASSENAVEPPIMPGGWRPIVVPKELLD